jgi:hypothetical protein
MMRLLKFLFTGDFHHHKWKILKIIHLIDARGNSEGHKYHLQCEHCGNLKFVETNTVSGHINLG